VRRGRMRRSWIRFYRGALLRSVSGRRRMWVDWMRSGRSSRLSNGWKYDETVSIATLAPTAAFGNSAAKS